MDQAFECNGEPKLAQGKLELPKKLTLRPRDISAALTMLVVALTLLLHLRSCGPLDYFLLE